MKFTIDIEEYDAEKGFSFVWEENAEVSVGGEDILIKANPAGLRNLANVLFGLAQAGVPSGEHVHIDDFDGLSSGSLIIERV